MRQLCTTIDRSRELLITVGSDSPETSRIDAMVSQQSDVFRLYLLRHAHAGWALPGGRDFDRALDASGRAEARSVALQAFTAGLAPARIISSPARRCAETTAIFLDVFGDVEASYDERLYSGGLEVYLELIHSHRSVTSLMLVGHNPMIEALPALLSRQGEIIPALAQGYPTAGLLALDFPSPLTGELRKHGRPALLLTPALI